MGNSRRCNKVFLVRPNYFCTIYICISTAVGLFYPRIGDRLSCVVLEMLKNVCACGCRFVSITISSAILYSITINKRNAIMTGSRN